MKRDVARTIARGRQITSKNPRRDLKTEEAKVMRIAFEECANECGVNEAIWETIIQAFCFGVAVGNDIATDKVKKADCVAYYKACKELNVPLDHFLQGE